MASNGLRALEQQSFSFEFISSETKKRTINSRKVSFFIIGNVKIEITCGVVMDQIRKAFSIKLFQTKFWEKS